MKSSFTSDTRSSVSVISATIIRVSLTTATRMMDSSIIATRIRVVFSLLLE